MTTHTFLSGHTTDGGSAVIKFEGCSPLRTARSRKYLVVRVSTATTRWDQKTQEFVPLAKPSVIVIGSTADVKRAHKLVNEGHLQRVDGKTTIVRDRILLERKLDGTYFVAVAR